MSDWYSDCRNWYRHYFNIEAPFEHQQQIWELFFNNQFPVLLRAPTGSGKTEAIVAPFLKQFETKQFPVAPRLIYVLPMRALVNSIHSRIEAYAQKISPAISVKVQHGDMPDAPFFIGDIIVTTLDQFVYGLARASQQVGRHIDIPAGAIASSLVIFDEAHMYRDGFTFSIMRAVVEILQKSHIPFVVMTATMPESLENSLFEDQGLFSEIQKIRGQDYINSTVQISFEDEPLYQDERVNISDNLLSKIQSKKTLIVLNQVKRAQKVYEEIKRHLDLSDEKIVLLHSRFTRKDREEHEKKALSLIPHKENGKVIIPEGAGIVVSTQVLEAGIDFSAELLLTELAPADCLVQRAGRCARYYGEEGEMIIVPAEDKGNLPYEKEHLEKTFEWLQKKENVNIKNFDEVCSFVNETLDYEASDYEARDTLVDLYECVLYADRKPENIQVRKSKPVTLVVVDIDIPEGGGEKVRKRREEVRKGIEDILKENPSIIRENSMDIDTGIAWSLFKDKNRPIQWEIQWRYNFEKETNKLSVIDLFKSEKSPDEEDARIGPFRTYILNKKYYKKDMGIKKDVS